jgi:hypothetical protein
MESGWRVAKSSLGTHRAVSRARARWARPGAVARAGARPGDRYDRGSWTSERPEPVQAVMPPSRLAMFE